MNRKQQNPTVDHRAHCTRPAAVSRRCRSAGGGASIRSGSARHWMRHGKPPGMQRLTREAAQRFTKIRVGDVTPERSAVLRVADDRPAGRREVHANLMRSPRDEPAFQEREAGGFRAHASEALPSRDARRAVRSTPRPGGDLADRGGGAGRSCRGRAAHVRRPAPDTPSPPGHRPAPAASRRALVRSSRRSRCRR